MTRTYNTMVSSQGRVTFFVEVFLAGKSKLETAARGLLLDADAATTLGGRGRSSGERGEERFFFRCVEDLDMDDADRELLFCEMLVPAGVTSFCGVSLGVSDFEADNVSEVCRTRWLDSVCWNRQTPSTIQCLSNFRKL